MSGAGGHPYLAIPGPSVMPERVLRAMHRPSPNIYAGELTEMISELTAGLCKVARTEGRVAIYIGNGHAAWEASLVNVLQPGDLVLIPATGFFGHGWGGIAEALGIEVQLLDFGRNSPVDMNQLEEVLRADTAHQIKAVLATHVDTSSSIRNDISAIRNVLDVAEHPALLMADCIASMACDRFEMDAWGADIALAASQKGLMVPPGLCFLFFNEKAQHARKKIDRVSRYWDWRLRSDLAEEFYQYFCGTAPTHHLFGLREALNMIAEEGIENIWARHEKLARAVWAACDFWSENGQLRLNVKDPENRSRAVTSLHLDKPNGTRLRHWLEKEMGVTLGIGLGMATDDDPHSSGAFRIGHMGHQNGHAVLGVLGAVEAGLHALNIAHGSGAVDAAARELARKS
ncbi:MAG: aminotransferase class V-fold PLP-dependent enzyme [Pseudomonadota bacterium]